MFLFLVSSSAATWIDLCRSDLKLNEAKIIKSTEPETRSMQAADNMEKSFKNAIKDSVKVDICKTRDTRNGMTTLFESLESFIRKSV